MSFMDQAEGVILKRHRNYDPAAFKQELELATVSSAQCFQYAVRCPDSLDFAGQPNLQNLSKAKHTPPDASCLLIVFHLICTHFFTALTITSVYRSIESTAVLTV